MSREAFDQSVRVIDFSKEPPRRVWVVSSPTGPDFVSADRKSAMQHAAEIAGDAPELGPYRVCEYVASALVPIDEDGARAAALEEAAEVADRHSTCANDTPSVIACSIRALKEKE